MFFSGLGCGWCYDKSNPTKGQCMSGSFNTTSSATCPQGEWAYAKCPDIDECQLGNYYNWPKKNEIKKSKSIWPKLAPSSTNHRIALPWAVLSLVKRGAISGQIL